MVYQAYLQFVEVDLLQRGDGVGVTAFDGPQLLVAAAVGVRCLGPAPLLRHRKGTRWRDEGDTGYDEISKGCGQCSVEGIGRAQPRQHAAGMPSNERARWERGHG